MKTKLFFLPIFIFLIMACEENNINPEGQSKILGITYSETSSVSSPQTISVKIEKPTPCHEVARVDKTVSGTTYSYDIILVPGAEVCADVIKEETVDVVFDPATTGTYTLNFLINGKLFETRAVNATE